MGDTYNVVNIIEDRPLPQPPDDTNGSTFEPAILHDRLRAAVKEYLTEGYTATLVGRFYSVTNKDDLEDFCDWFTNLAVESVRYSDRKRKNLGQ